MAKVNLQKAASYVARENTGKIDTSVAQASEDVSNYNNYLTENHTLAEIVALYEGLKEEYDGDY